jgi:1-acyl-sn-glycerol-3-phosphate acyltransferase
MTAMLADLQQGYEHPAGEYWVPARLGGSAPTLDEANKMDAADAEAKAASRKARETGS